MLQSISWPDRDLVRDLQEGFCLLGDFPHTGITRPSQAPLASLQSGDLARRFRELNADTLKRVLSARPLDKETQDAFEQRNQDEVTSGIAIWRRVSDAVLVSPRFCVSQGHRWKPDVGWTLKLRPVDDFSYSQVNLGTSSRDRVEHEGLDHLVCLARQVHSRTGARDLRLRKEDFCNAFRTLPLKEDHLPFAGVTWTTAARSGWCLQMLAAPFGATSSVYSWERTERLQTRASNGELARQLQSRRVHRTCW